jgi:hypothetical protein
VRVRVVADTVNTFTVGKRRFPKTVALLVTMRELMVVTPCKDTLFETTNELRVVVPTGTLKAPLETVTLFVTTNALTVFVPVNEALFVTTNELRVVVPAATLNPPLETVTFPPADGLRIILEFARLVLIVTLLKVMLPVLAMAVTPVM